MDPGRVRAFVALSLPEAFAARLGAIMRELQPLAPGLRFVRSEGAHLTLRFFGSATAEQLSILEPRLRSAASHCPRGAARASGLGVFPKRGAPRVLFIGLALPERFASLQRDCEAAAVAAGFAAEARRFHPHVTLGRWKDRGPRPPLPEVDLGEWALDELVLFRSDTQSGGSVYTPLSRYALPS